MLLSGSQILIECLIEQGVDTIFGYPGGTVLNIYDEFYKRKSEIKHILTSHEQGAAYAADGYARATGKVGVCIATSGPGATNLVTGIAASYMDSVPVVAITGNVGVSFLGKDSFQEVDIAGITMPITKHNFIVKDISKLADTVRRAFKIAKEGRPGPVLIDIVKDVTESDNKIEFKPCRKIEDEHIKNIPNEDCFKKAIRIIKKSKRPVILLGGGAVISTANDVIKEFVYKLDAPVCDTLMGKGSFDANEELYLGMIGMHGTPVANMAIKECDLLIAAGVRFNDRITGNSDKFARDCKVIHIDIDPAEINKNMISDVSIVGDIKYILSELNKRIECYNHDKWNDYVIEYKKENVLIYEKDRLTVPYVIEKINEIVDDAIIVTDVGQHQMWTAQYYRFKEPHTFLTSGGLGAMGYGLGAAIGAKIGQPNKIVINISGDGCFRMNMNEIATASRYKIPIIDIVMNNKSLGMVRQWQSMFYGKRYSQTEINDNVDLCKVASALGAKTFKIVNIFEVEDVLNEALKCKTPVVIECVIDNNDMVLPMVTTSVTGQK